LLADPASSSGWLDHPPDRPQEGGHLAGDRCDRDRRPLSGRDQPPIAGAQPNLRFPGNLSNCLRQAL